MSIQEIKEAVGAMPPKERAAFFDWVDSVRETPEPAPVPYERIAHLAGIHKGGPRDLSTNKRYLEGLGESSLR